VRFQLLQERKIAYFFVIIIRKVAKKKTNNQFVPLIPEKRFRNHPQEISKGACISRKTLLSYG
jgi:hypothetical protein